MENHHTLQSCSLQRSAKLELLALFLSTKLELTPPHTLSLTILHYINLARAILFYYTKPIQQNSAFETKFCFIPYEPLRMESLSSRLKTYHFLSKLMIFEDFRSKDTDQRSWTHISCSLI